VASPTAERGRAVLRSAVGLAEVADWHNLVAAFHRAAKGASNRAAVQRFREGLFDELARLRKGILDENLPLGEMAAFRIQDPKPRLIHAPSFRERVLHHAVMAQAGPVLDRALIDDTYACRVGKGALAAVHRCQHLVRRHPWYVQIDIRGYFASIHHEILGRLLQRRFKDAELLRLMAHIIDAFHDSPGKGLPIGALTSQHFANYYLAPLDRRLSGDPRVRGLVRYMDDLVWWCDDHACARATLADAEACAGDELALAVKQPPRIGRGRDGLSFCGYRILPGALLLSRRRKRRYAQRRAYWERAYAQGRVDARAMQAGYSAVLGMTVHADATAWRREQLRRHPLEEVIDEL